MALKKSKRAERDWDNYQTYRDDSLEWRTIRDKLQKFYFGDQWSLEGGKKMQARGQSDIVINKIRQLLRMRVSMMTANKPTGRIFAVRQADIETATLFEEFTDWHLYNSDYAFHLERAVMGQQRIGVHYLTVYDDPVADYNQGELKVGNESYRHVYLDKAAGQNWDFSDAPRMIQTKLRRPEDWLLSLPPKIRARFSEDDVSALSRPNDEIYWTGEHKGRESNEIDTPVSVDTLVDEKVEWIREMDIYERTMVDVPILKDAQGIIFAAGDPDGDWNADQKEMIDQGVLVEAEVILPRIKFRKNISGRVLLPLDANDMSKVEDVLPIADYPLVPVIDEDTGNALPLGEVDFQAGIQEMLNVAVSLTLLNASLSSNLKIMLDSGKAGTTIEKFRKEYAVPGGVMDVRFDPQTGKPPVEIIRPEPLTQAWHTMAQMLSQEIEFQASRGLSLRAGDPTAAPETFAATLQLGQWAQDILRIPLSRLELALERVMNLILTWAPSYYDFEKVFYTFDSDAQPIQKSLNFSTMENMKARFRIRAGSTMPSQTVSELGIMQSMAQLNPALIGAVIDRMPGLRDNDKKELKQTIDLVAQLQQQGQQKDEVIDVLQQQMQHLQESNIALQKEATLAPLKREVDLAKARIKDMTGQFQKVVDKSNSKEK